MEPGFRYFCSPCPGELPFREIRRSSTFTASTSGSSHGKTGTFPMMSREHFEQLREVAPGQLEELVDNRRTCSWRKPEEKELFSIDRDLINAIF